MKLLIPIFTAFGWVWEESSPNQIASGVLLGMLLGLHPLFSLQGIALLGILLTFRINIFSFIGSYVVFACLAMLLDPLFHLLGLHLLTGIPALQKLWTWLVHAPLLPFTYFNSSIVMGRGVVSLVLAIPLFTASRHFMKTYGKRIRLRLSNVDILRTLVETRLVRLYSEYQNARKS